MYEQVDGNKVGTWGGGFITIFGGTGEQAKIMRFIQTESGDDNGRFITLEDCRKMFKDKFGGESNHLSIYVWFNYLTHGEIYNYGNHGNTWERIGTTEGFA